MNWKYVRNPSSSKDALLTKEPGKAFGKSTDYQGNIKMKKFDLFGKKGLHPDAQFVKTNKNNVKEEKGVVRTKIRLIADSHRVKQFQINSSPGPPVLTRRRRPLGLWGTLITGLLGASSMVVVDGI